MISSLSLVPVLKGEYRYSCDASLVVQMPRVLVLQCIFRLPLYFTPDPDFMLSPRDHAGTMGMLLLSLSTEILPRRRAEGRRRKSTVFRRTRSPLPCRIPDGASRALRSAPHLRPGPDGRCISSCSPRGSPASPSG